MNSVSQSRPLTDHRSGRRAAAGFTLIELMIAVAIVAILGAVALPWYKEAVFKSRRATAMNAINAVQQAQERWRGNRAAYAPDAQLTVPPGPPASGASAGLGLPSQYSHYSLVITAADATSYVITATATGAQAADEKCKVMAVRLLNGNLVYGSGAAINFDGSNPDPNRCWAR